MTTWPGVRAIRRPSAKRPASVALAHWIGSNPGGVGDGLGVLLGEGLPVGVGCGTRLAAIHEARSGAPSRS